MRLNWIDDMMINITLLVPHHPHHNTNQSHRQHGHASFQLFNHHPTYLVLELHIGMCHHWLAL